MSDAFLALVLGVAPGCETVSAWDEFLTSGATAEKSFVPLDNSHSSYAVISTTCAAAATKSSKNKGGGKLFAQLRGQFRAPTRR